ncbi:Transmembrane transport protein MmpL [Corynebacterium kutscheri]|uniref:Putative RND superfamily drug exporter n=1 Tax=Corynebacterium kutscheri TaxID=35755 RepID=A0A0F6TE00_9CORY|nr:MMPL family transporter [Corynebacterium kutscheri]AKE42116.1 putative RND superfamily drug exporter [Corynebacterium kutscheri]VEH10459.1 Transmembrane transport protein MmpL [Corynebacterium kutscheri]VEH81838.1 Transmembrane transport protein MmpL [Corynebacterium kutscheri]
MFSIWGDFAYRHRKIVPTIIIATILALYGILGVQLADRMSQEGWDDPHSSSTMAAAIEKKTFGRDNSGDIILLFSATTDIDDSGQSEAIKNYLTTLKEDHPQQIESITSYFDNRNPRLKSDDGTTAFAAVALHGDDEQTLKDFRIIQEDLSPQFEGINVQVAGATAVADALDAGMARDIQRAEIYALPAVALLLLLVFGSVVATGMPLIVGGLSILGSLGMLSLLAGFTQVNVFAQSVVTLLGLGLAIDYGLFMVSRFREELDNGHNVPDAVRITTVTAGKTVVFSAAMVAVALSGLLIFPQAFLKSVAYGAISAVGLAALLSITVLPSLFGLLGHRIDLWSIRRGSRTARRLEDTWWYRLPQWAMKRSILVTSGLIILLIALSVPLVGVKFGGINETYLPPTNDVRVAQQKFDQEFPEFRTDPIKLVITNASNEQLVDIFQQANQVTGLTGRFSASSATVDGTTVLSAGIENRENNASVVEQLRTLDVPNGVSVYIGGTPAMEVESIEALFEKLPWMATYIIVATFVLMALVFGSLILPAKAIIMTVLGMGATLGLLTLMFVDGVGTNIFNFTAGPLMSPVLVLIMSIVYGLSTDYEVFLVSRMVEARENDESTDEAIKYGTAHTGGIITAAALIMIVVCGAFGFSEIVMMKYIAFGMIFALLFDATIIRMLLVPAVMHLLKEDNWWAPRCVKVAADKLGHNNVQLHQTHQSAEFLPAHNTQPVLTPSMEDTTEVSLPLPSTYKERTTTTQLTRAAAMETRSTISEPDDDIFLSDEVVFGDDNPPADTKPSAASAVQPTISKETSSSEEPVTETHSDENSIFTAQPIVPNQATRGGRVASQDNELIPFSELLKQMQKRENNT